MDASDGLQSVRCFGEVTNLSQSNAAVYFSLTDGECELPCMIWGNHYWNMNVDLEDGLEIVIHGNIGYWVEGGKTTSNLGESPSSARYLDNSEEMVRERYSHIEAGELGDVATEALADVDGLQ